MTDEAAHRAFDDTVERTNRQCHEEDGHSHKVTGCPLCHPRTLDARRRHREAANRLMAVLSEVRNHDRALYDEAMRKGATT